MSSAIPDPSSDTPSPAGGPEPNRRQRASKPSEIIGGLVLVATPIGNAGDISSRALGLLATADIVACEDTRVTSKLFAVHGLKTPLLSYHEHNAAQQRPKLIKRLKDGETVALVSDAGMPTISDPGFKLINACVDEGIALTCIPGASAVTTALALSGLPTDRFFFQGFLPSKKTQRRKVLGEIGRIPGSLVVMESAKRLAAMLADAADILGPRACAVTRELTKRFEEVRRGTLGELAQHYDDSGPPKGEITLVIGPPGADETATTGEQVDALLREALVNSSVRDAAAEVAAMTGWPKRDVYQRALSIEKDTV